MELIPRRIEIFLKQLTQLNKCYLFDIQLHKKYI
jgi:hypothetical protein